MDQSSRPQCYTTPFGLGKETVKRLHNSVRVGKGTVKRLLVRKKMKDVGITPFGLGKETVKRLLEVGSVRQMPLKC